MPQSAPRDELQQDKKVEQTKEPSDSNTKGTLTMKSGLSSCRLSQEQSL